MVNYVLAAAARAQAAAMMAELEIHRPGAAQHLVQGALAEMQTWPELTVRRVAEDQTGPRCSVAGAYEPGPPPQIVVADSASPARQDFTALHELGHHLQQNSFALMDAFAHQPDRGVLLEDAACDAFAAEILLPAPLVEHHLAADGPTAPDIVELWRASTPAVLRGLTWGNVERWECSGREVVTDGFCPHAPRRSAPDGKVAPGLGSLGS